MNFLSEPPETASELIDVAADGAISARTRSHFQSSLRDGHDGRFQDLLAASNLHPERVLVAYTEFARHDLSDMVWNDVLFCGCAGLVPAWFIGALTEKWSHNANAGWLVGLTLAFAPVAYVLYRAYFKRHRFWQTTMWVDLVARNWRARTVYPGRIKADKHVSIAFDRLALVYFSRSWEQGFSYEVALCTLDGWRQPGINSPGSLWHLFMADTPEEALAFIAELSALWGIACWQWEDGSTPTLSRLDPAPTPPPPAPGRRKKHG